MKTNTQRNYGIDLLRLFAMFLIVMYHVITHGGFASVTGILAAERLFLFTIAFCAVDCYAIISGFVGYVEEEKPYRFYKYITLWLEVFFYSFVLFFIASFFDKSITTDKLLSSALPVLTNKFWYFTAYTPLFFLIPFLNKLVRNCSKKELTLFVGILFILFSVLSFLADPFVVNNGYSALSLIVLYIVGAWMKKCEIPSKIKTPFLWLMLSCTILLTWVGTAFLPEWTRGPYLLKYSSPTVICSAFCFVGLFAKIKVEEGFQKVIAFTAPTSFGIYILHCSNLVWNNFIVGKHAYIAELSPFVFPFGVIGSALLVFLCCMVVEKVRSYLFALLRVDKGAQWVQTTIEKRFFKERN